MNGASSTWTRRVLVAGTVLSAACFLVALVLDLLGRSAVGDRLLDPGALAASVFALESGAWASLGTLVVIVTPAAALVTTLLEYRRAGDRVAVLASSVVLGILALSLALALLGRA